MNEHVHSVKLKWFSFAEQTFYESFISINKRLSTKTNTIKNSTTILGLYITHDSKLEVWHVTNVYDQDQRLLLLGVGIGTSYNDNITKHTDETELFRSKGRIPIAPSKQKKYH